MPKTVKGHANEAGDRRLRAGEPLVAGLSRVLTAAVTAAREELDSADDGNIALRIHRARRELKLARTILRLLKPLTGQRGKELRSLARTAMAVLSEKRDQHVIGATIDKLMPELRGEREKNLLASLAPTKEMAASGKVEAKRALTPLRRLGHLLQRLSLPAGSEPVVRRRAGALYRKARAGWHKAQAQDDVDSLHLWRKSVKDRLHLAALFRAHWPEPTGPRRGKLDRIGELLGQDRDLYLVGTLLPPHDAAAKPVRRLVEGKRTRLEHRAFALAAEIFDRRPKEIARSWRDFG